MLKEIYTYKESNQNKTILKKQIKKITPKQPEHGRKTLPEHEKVHLKAKFSQQSMNS